MAPQQGLRGRDLGLALVICLVWAGNFLTSAFALREIPPFLFTALRLVILALVLGAFVKPPQRGQWPLLVAVALCNGVLHFGLSFWALQLAGNLSSPAIVMQNVRADGGLAGAEASGGAGHAMAAAVAGIGRDPGAAVLRRPPRAATVDRRAMVLGGVLVIAQRALAKARPLPAAEDV